MNHLTKNAQIDLKVANEFHGEFQNMIRTIASHGGNTRELAIAKSNAEQALLWIRRHIELTGTDMEIQA